MTVCYYYDLGIVVGGSDDSVVAFRYYKQNIPNTEDTVSIPNSEKAGIILQNHRLLVMVSNFHVQALRVCTAQQRP